MASEETIEAVADVIEDVVEVRDEVITVVRNNPLLIVGATVVGLAVGGVVGYKVAQHRLREYYDEIAQADIEEAKAFYASVNKKDAEGNDVTPEQLVQERYAEQAVEALQDYKGLPEAKEFYGKAFASEQSEEERTMAQQSIAREVKEEVVVASTDEADVAVVKQETKSVFVSGKVVDLDLEAETRDADRPYVITSEEYFANDPENEQHSLVYFSADDVLADDQSVPIPDPDGIVGDDNLLRFGHGSKDPNLVYIRNEAQGTDFEIARSGGSYADEVLGFDSSNSRNAIRHSDGYGKSRRFRHED